MKSGGGYDDPWITLDFPSIDVAHARLSDAARKGRLVEVFQVTAQASAKFAELTSVGKPAKPAAAAGGGGGQSRAPQGAQEAPNGEKKYCDHGEMVYKSGVSTKGNAYKLFSCIAPRDQQCKAQYPAR